MTAPKLPGTWRPTQMLSGRVYQWAYLCPACKKTFYILESGASMKPGSRRREVCCQRKGAKPFSLCDERYPESWTADLLKALRDIGVEEAVVELDRRRVAAAEARRLKREAKIRAAFGGK